MHVSADLTVTKRYHCRHHESSLIERGKYQQLTQEGLTSWSTHLCHRIIAGLSGLDESLDRFDANLMREFVSRHGP
jgi:hypothetical protein